MHPRDRHLTVRFFTSASLLTALLLGTTPSAHAVGNTFFDGFNSFDTSRWQKADGWTNGGAFNCGWRADHVSFWGMPSERLLGSRVASQHERRTK